MDRPFALFGHSIGALIAFNLARWLREHAGLSPALLLVSGRYAPHLPSLRPAVHALPDDRFFAELKYYGATPDELLHDEDLRALFLPVLRADFALFETATYISQAPLSCPIVALSGQDDHTVTLERVEAWREHTTNRFTLRELPGGHFFLNTHRGALLAALGEELVPVLVADSSARRSWLPRRQPSPLDR
jgi:surfactin synthase thioesterase subunit